MKKFFTFVLAALVTTAAISQTQKVAISGIPAKAEVSKTVETTISTGSKVDCELIKTTKMHKASTSIKPVNKDFVISAPANATADAPSIEEIVGNYKWNGSTAIDVIEPVGQTITIEAKTETTVSVTINMNVNGFTPKFEATYSNGVLSIPVVEGPYDSNNGGTLYFGAWNTQTATVMSTTATWNGNGFAFTPATYVGFGLEGKGWLSLASGNVWNKMRDGDYAAEITLGQRTFKDNIVNFSVNVGTDATDALYYVINGSFTASTANLDYVAEIGTSIDTGDYTLDFSKVTPGVKTIFLVSLDDDGNVAEGVAKWVFVQDYSNDNWNSLGYALYTDDIFYGAFPSLNEYQGDQWKVEVQQNKTDATKYRLVNLFGEQSGWQDLENDPLASIDHFVNYSITDEGVEIDLSPIGLQFSEANDGFFMTDEEPGTCENNVITFPTKGLFFTTAAKLETWNGWYSNNQGLFKLELPGQLTVNVKNNDLPAAGATVSIDEQDYTTDANGNVIINVDAAGDKSYDVIIALGTDSQDSTVDFKANGKAELNVSFGTSAINDINAETVAADAPVYNLAGQRVENNAKGILIQNGKKFVNNK